MKRSMILAAAAVLGGASMLTSCKNEGEATMTAYVPAYNLITSNQPGVEPTVCATTYRYDVDYNTNKITVGADQIDLNGTKTSFTTAAMAAKSTFYTTGNSTHEVLDMSSLDAGTTNNGLAIDNFKCQLTTMLYVIPTAITGVPAMTIPSGQRYTVMSYNVGSEYTVRTFWWDVVFRGTTYIGSNEAGNIGSYMNEDIYYRIQMDIPKKKAMVVMYQIKFSEGGTLYQAIVLENLDLVFSNNGYAVSGTNVVPKVAKTSGTLAEDAELKFDSINFTVGGDLTSGVCDYEIAGGKYDGRFTGNCILKPSASSGN